MHSYGNRQIHKLKMQLPLSRWRVVWLHYFKEIDCKEVANMLYIHTVRRITTRYNTDGDVSPVHGPTTWPKEDSGRTRGVVYCRNTHGKPIHLDLFE